MLGFVSMCSQPDVLGFVSMCSQLQLETLILWYVFGRGH